MDVNPEHPDMPVILPERWTVDGVEQTPSGPLARLERLDGSTFTLPLSNLPEGVQEGDLLDVQDGPDGAVAHRLPAQTLALQEQQQAQLDALNAQDTLAVNENGEITL